jgi:ribosomal protein S18 acetylase RimI-like enzyme
VIGTVPDYRGQRLPNNTSIGDFVLRDALLRIEGAHQGQMPFVWALVHPDNEPSKALFRRRQFDIELPQAADADMYFIRPDGEPVK